MKFGFSSCAITGVLALKSHSAWSFTTNRAITKTTFFPAGGTKLYSSAEEDEEPEPKPRTKTEETITFQKSSIDAEILPKSGAKPIIQSTYVPPQGEAWKHGYFPNQPKLITFDAVDTLIQLRSDVGMFYREVLFEATEYNARLPRPEFFSKAFLKAFGEMDAKNPCFGCGQGMSSREWWHEVVFKTYDYVELTEPFLREEMDDWLLEEVFDALYTDVFVTDEAWELRPGALEALSHFVEWKQKGGPALAILTNFDERMYSVLKNLDILDAFDFVLTSREIGAAKPDRRAFEVAMSRMGITDAASCMHVGDDFEVDVAGASKAGWHAVFIPANGEQEIPEGVDERLVFSMPGDLFQILRMYGREPDKRIIFTTRHVTEKGIHGFEQKIWSTTEDATEQPTISLPPPPERKSWEGPGRL